MKYFGTSVGVLVTLVALAVVQFVLLLMSREPDPPKPERSSIVASKDLRAFTLIESDSLTVLAAPGQEAPDPRDLIDRYLLLDVDKGGEIKDDMLAVRDAKSVLNDAVIVSIPATVTSSLGGQLRAGELVDLIAVPLVNPTGKLFEKLVVLSSTKPNKDTGPPTTIMLAVPSGKTKDFAEATASAQLIVSRRIPANQ